ncbi:unnamed protein product [Adineta steineri]|uniref:Uncharacterized protein n=1 Tax=Adineta steineri TaxID=433720 RepID=A0A819P6G4_9BILA|nr:unnamed protein product [Adineta steineri]CAF1436506.1 unnamed protein product [Adineta steineri]CAF4008052.1 unnamed protein product [Adineta steineri]
MQHNPSDSNTHQDSLINQLASYETELTNQPISLVQYSQQSINSTDCKISVEHQHDQILSHQLENAITIPTRRLTESKQVLITITAKLQRFFVISGIIYLLWGMSLISVETAIIMYNISAFYRGLFIGILVLATGINLLVVANTIFYSINYLMRLLYVTLAFALFGIGMCVIDLVSSDPCNDHKDDRTSLCDTKTATKLKLILLAQSMIVTIYTGIIIKFAKRIRKKAKSISSNSSTSHDHY